MFAGEGSASLPSSTLQVDRSGVGRIAMLVYDLRTSGVTRNAMRIARAARRNGLEIDLWPIRGQGDLPDAGGEVSIRPIRSRSTRLQRDVDSLSAVPALARAIDRERPALLFSAGNHTH